ncbi:MAG TPA: outer membrane beta-barrel protein [Spirochaetota bacterium]|nr:outer membrane beta-barrel protein [Spirochaetota bacterium]
MKKLIVSIGAVILMFCASGIYAQAGEQANPVAKGNLVIKLFDIGYSFARSGDLYDGDDADIFGINDSHLGMMNDAYYPVGTEVNYFIIDGLAVGGSVHYASTETSSGDSIDIWSIGPSVHYYYNTGSAILPYASLSYIYSKAKIGETIDYDFTRIPIGAGAAFMLGEHIALYGQFVYSFNSKDNGTDAIDGTMAIFSAGVKAFF